MFLEAQISKHLPNYYIQAHHDPVTGNLITAAISNLMCVVQQPQTWSVTLIQHCLQHNAACQNAERPSAQLL
jgi:hypothetical protein